MLKKIVIAACLFVAGFNASAQRYYREGERERQRDAEQQDEQTYGDGFKREHLFIGGNVGLGYDSYTFNAGISPEIGYSVARWLDVGALVNLNYTSYRADPNYYYNNNERVRTFNYGLGTFVRAYPLPFLFLQAGPEYNWIHYSYKFFDPPGETGSYNTHAASMLVGIGYGQRIVGRSSMHIALMVDLLNNAQSPYRDGNGSVIPVLKAGFDIYFKPRKH